LIETLGIQITAGRAFSRKFGAEDSKIIFNEAAIAAMGLEDPVGKTVIQWEQEKEIIGVVKNFHFESLHERVKPCFIQLSPDGKNVMVKIATGREVETIDRLREFYRSYNLGLPFEFKFLDDEYQKVYESEIRIGVLAKYFAAIAIVISCLGLFGLAAFTAERRLKEIGIRKVSGSSTFGIVGLLSGDFTELVVAAIVLALPVSYFVARNWLDDFAYRIDLPPWYFLSAGSITLLIAWFTVGAQALKAATVNPVRCLRDE
jgi:ABC-type antimicrobial peptide transport system permease subunit